MIKTHFTLGLLLFQPFSHKMKFGWLELAHGWARLSNKKLIFPPECHFCLVDTDNFGSSIAKLALSKYSYNMVGSSENSIFKDSFSLPGSTYSLRTLVVPFIMWIQHMAVKPFLWARHGDGVKNLTKAFKGLKVWWEITQRIESRKKFTFKCSCLKTLCNCEQAFRWLLSSCIQRTLYVC